jgi:diguanylate cyclase (GGDEF)-like protein
MTWGPDVAQAADKAADKGLLPLFLLSFHHRDDLAAVAKRSRRRVIAARRMSTIERRFINSGAAIATVDARDALAEGLSACEILAGTTRSIGAALLVILNRSDIDALDQFLEAGATHYLIGGFDDQEFLQMLRFADRFVRRLAGGSRVAAERAALRHAEAEIWQWRPGARTVMFSPALAERMGSVGGDAAVHRLLGASDRDGRRLAMSAIARLLADGQPTAFAHWAADGKYRLAHHIHYDEERRVVVGWVETVGDDGIMLHLPRDSLTGLPPVETLRQWVGELLADRAAAEPRCVLMLLGVARFGLINAAFGRVTGDALLQGVARRIERTIAGIGLPRFMVARTAGSEFAIAFAPSIPADMAELVAHRLVESVSRPFVSGETLIPLSCRAGVAAADCERQGDTASLFRRASAALSATKHGDSGLVRTLDARGEAETYRRNQLEVDLRRALDDDQIDILFQPQVDIRSGDIVGAEALARWRHPQLGEIGAVALFSTAARSDFVVQLSAYVQRRALRLAAAWPSGLSGLRLAVNVTADDIARPTFVADFLALVDESGFPRSRLTIELTEGGLIADLPGAAVMLAALRGAGLRVAIDDFGTGYSSLAYLKTLPLDYLKIDKALAEDITGSSRDRIVVRGVIDMARSLGLAVITEGVETDTQLALLAREGCDYYQGFLCAPPIDSLSLLAIVQNRLSTFDPSV